MKTTTAILFTFLVSLMVVSCGSAGKMTDSSGGRDGSSFEKAIIAYSLRAEYKWIDNAYPGARLLSQVITGHDGKFYDIVSVMTSEGVEKSVYFDVSKFHKEKQYQSEEGQQ